MEERTTLGIIDNDPLVLQALTESFIQQNAPVQILWELTDAREALTLMTSQPDERPQLIITDIEMPHMDGLQFYDALRAEEWPIEVIGISAFVHIRQNTAGEGMIIMPKESTVKELLQLAGFLLHNDKLAKWSPVSHDSNPLSPSEIQTLQYYAQGYTTEAIARSMHISQSSVKTFVKRIYTKLGVHSRTQAIVTCIRNGWI